MKNLLDPKLLAEFQLKPAPLAKISAFLDAQPDITASRLCNVIGIEPQRIYKWRSENKASNSALAVEERPGKLVVKPCSSNKAKYSASDKLALLKQYEKVGSAEQAEILRSYGLYQSDIRRWREVADSAALEFLGKRKPRSDKKSDESRAVEGLQKEVATHEKTIAKLAALVTFQKKLSDLLRGSESK